MDLDSAIIWKATRDADSMARAKELGVGEHLFKGAPKSAWRFIEEYKKDHGGIPGVGIIAEQTGAIIREPDDNDRADMSYLADQLYKRHEFRCLQHGISEASGYLEEGEQDDAAEEIHRLSDALKAAKVKNAQVTTLAEEAEGVIEMYGRTKNGEIGVPFPWDAMNDMTFGMWPKTLTFFVARPGIGKCVHKDTLIVDPLTGIPRTIEDVHLCGRDMHRRVTTWSKDGGIHATPITAKVDTGTKECLRFTTSSGRGVVVTPEHPFMTPEGWRRADQVKPGMSLATPARMPFPEEPVRMHGSEVDVMATLLSGGVYSGSSANEKAIPDDVFRLPKDQLARFMSLLWMYDGTVSEDGLDVTMTLGSEHMVRQVQSLMLRFGIQSMVTNRRTKGGPEAWRLMVYGQFLDVFYESFDSWGQKPRLGSKKRNQDAGCPRVSDAKVNELKGVVRGKPGSCRDVATTLGRTSFKAGDLFGEHNSIKMTAFRGFASTYGVEDEYRWWWDSDIFWDQVDSVEPAGEQKVYDLTVEPTECFVANDIIVHNTWSAIIIAMHVWSQGIEKGTRDKVLIISPEMSRVELAERMVSKYGKIPYGDLVAGTLGTFGEPALRSTVDTLKEVAQDLYILDDEDRLQPEHIEAAIDAIQPTLVVFDAVYLMNVDAGKVKKGPGSKGGRYDRIHETLDWMRRLSRRKAVPILGISQLSRDGKVKKGDANSVKRGEGTGGLEDALAFTDTLLMDVHNLFAVWQDVDMKLDRKLMFVPLKVRRRAKSNHVVISWDMESMNFEQIGTSVEAKEGRAVTGSDGRDSGSEYNDDFSNVPF